MSWVIGYSIPDFVPTSILELILTYITEYFTSDVQFVHPVNHFWVEDSFVLKWVGAGGVTHPSPPTRHQHTYFVTT
jgi:hypothetical protein